MEKYVVLSQERLKGSYHCDPLLMTSCILLYSKKAALVSLGIASAIRGTPCCGFEVNGKADDLFMVSDVDEIPRLSVLKFAVRRDVPVMLSPNVLLHSAAQNYDRAMVPRHNVCR